MTHTPGPWTVFQDPSLRRTIGTATHRICDMWGSSPAFFTDEDEANARLIAAAPELLMVLSYALADLDDVMPEYEPSGDRTHPGWQTIEDIKVVLAKATGQKETA